ncbi:MAG TPA: mercuric reductase [Thermoanaerobaculia bacterium]|nr:mercuric reductase [Thermoanaerobaculia bacterium]
MSEPGNPAAGAQEPTGPADRGRDSLPRREVHEPPRWATHPPAGSDDERLVAQVHPPAWANPEPAARYHLVVVGAGTAGLVSAAGAAGLGARVALVERSLMGGDCLNVGCVPSKGMIRAARAWSEARRTAERFGGPAAEGAGDFAAAMERMRRLRADMARHDSAERFAELGVDVFLGHGRFVAPDAVEVDGRRLRFRRAVVATGARAAAPPIPGLAEAGYLTNETVFDLHELPRRLAVIGGGPIGCELAQAFARFGSRVTLLDLAEHVLVREDADAAAVVQRALVADGVRLELGVSIERVELAGGERRLHVRRGGEAGEVAADAVLVAVGRTPNVEGLALEAAGVGHDSTGVAVDDRLRTTNPRIYAAGDVSSRWKFTHVADAEARIVIQNALFRGRKKASDLVVPWCTYTSPEVAHVGLTAAEAAERGVELDTVTVPLSAVDRAILDGETEGFLRLHLAAGKGRILGATVVAEHAGDLLGELALAITAGVGLDRIAGVIHPYPTQAEVVKKAADQWRRGKLTPAVKKVFGWWFRLTG